MTVGAFNLERFPDCIQIVFATAGHEANLTELCAECVRNRESSVSDTKFCDDDRNGNESPYHNLERRES